MQAALQRREHRLQCLHFPASSTGRSNEKREKKPNTVPTGQMVLQYVRPLRYANIANRTNITTAMMNVGKLFSQTSVS